jgi:CRP-like cAMP-binding protein
MLTPAETVEIFEKYPDKQIPAGTVIFKQGEVGAEMFGIVSGEVELSMNGKVIEIIQAGDVFGEGALVQSDRSRYTTAIAKTNCILACMNLQHFEFALQETPLFALEVVRSLSTRLRCLKDLVA